MSRLSVVAVRGGRVRRTAVMLANSDGLGSCLQLAHEKFPASATFSWIVLTRRPGINRASVKMSLETRRKNKWGGVVF